MNCKFILSALVLALLAGCGAVGDRKVTDGSGNPVYIGSAPANAGPGSPGWPVPTGAAAN